MMDVCSLGGKSGYAYNAAYSAAKHGLSAIADTLRQELAIDGALYRRGHGGIILTTVYPGPTVSEFGKSAPDLTAGEAASQVLASRGSQSLVRRRVSAAQPTVLVARAMSAALFRPVWTIYPHRWANIAVLLNNFAPGLTLRLVGRTRR
jgi:short-subunit dehydrogenase